MDPEFWHERWRRRQIGFHRDTVHPALATHWARVGVPPPARVLVPLCGKSPDLPWLWRRGHDVVGVELSPLAIEELFAELAPDATVSECHGHRLWRAGTPGGPALSVIEGDLFALAPADVGPVAAIYDRASLIAFPPERRPDYVAALGRLGLVPTLLVTVDYPAHEMDGPPFAVTDDEVHRLYGAAFEVRCLEVADRLQEERRFRERGVTRFEERVYLLRPRTGG